MALTLNGSNNTIAGLAVGGLPDGIVDTDMLAATAVTRAKTNLPGSILQIVSSHTCSSVASTSQTWADTGLTANITPSSTSSKILVVALLNGCHTASSGNINQLQLQLLKDSTVIDVFATEAGHSDGHLNHMDIGTGGAVTHLNSPNTTSQVTFKVQFRKRLDITKTVTVQYASSCSYITLYEVAG